MAEFRSEPNHLRKSLRLVLNGTVTLDGRAYVLTDFSSEGFSIAGLEGADLAPGTHEVEVALRLPTVQLRFATRAVLAWQREGRAGFRLVEIPAEVLDLVRRIVRQSLGDATAPRAMEVRDPATETIEVLPDLGLRLSGADVEVQRRSFRRRFAAYGAAGLLVFPALGLVTQSQQTLQSDDARVHGDVVRVGSPTSARIRTIHVREGWVDEGELLVELDDADEAIRVRELRALLDKRRASLAATERLIEEEAARSRLYSGAAKSKVEALEGRRRAAALDLREAREEAERAALLFERRALTRDDLQRARSAERSRRADWQALEAEVALAREMAAAAEEGRYFTGTRVLGRSDELARELDEKRLEADRVAVQLERAVARLERNRIYAPRDGRVQQVLFTEGETVRAGDQLVTLEVPERFSVIAHFDRASTERISRGDRATIHVPDLGRQFEGHVKSVGSDLRDLAGVSATAPGTLVQIVWTDEPPDLRSGQRAAVEIDTGTGLDWNAWRFVAGRERADAPTG